MSGVNCWAASWRGQGAWNPVPPRLLKSLCQPSISLSAIFSTKYSWIDWRWAYVPEDWYLAVGHRRCSGWTSTDSLCSKPDVGLMPDKYSDQHFPPWFQTVPLGYHLWKSGEFHLHRKKKRMLGQPLQLSCETHMPNCFDSSIRFILIEWMNCFDSLIRFILKMEFLPPYKISVFPPNKNFIMHHPVP